MTKKDYEKIAAVLRQNQGKYDLGNDNTPPYVVLSDLASDLAVMLQFDNDRFNQDKFLEACGL